MVVKNLFENFLGDSYVTLVINGNISLSADADYCRMLITARDLRMQARVVNWNLEVLKGIPKINIIAVA